MNKNLFLTALSKMNDWIFLLITVLYQLLFIFQGLDFADEGFYATFYQQIFSNPQSISFNFMYWFSGILGGAFLYLFPSLGLLGLRLFGIIIVTSTIATVYFSLKKYLTLVHLRLGIFILLFFISNDPKEMYYNNLSAFLFVLSAVFIFNGLKNNTLSNIFYSGAFISLNMFTRSPSIIGLIFGLAILYYGFITDLNFKNRLKQIGSFLFGFVSMTIAVLFIMKAIGHLDLFIENLGIVYGMGTKSDSGNNMIRLIKLFINDYSSSIIYGFLLISFIFILSSIHSLISQLTKFNPKTIINLSLSLLFAISVYFILSHKISWLNILWVFSGLSMIFSILILTSASSKKELKLFTLLGCLILLIQPFGSAVGLSMMGRYSLWIIFPITINYIFNVKSVKTEINISSESHSRLLNIYIDEHQICLIRKYFWGICIIGCLYFSYYYPYFDMSNRTKMSYSVDSKYLKGIYTTKERAFVVNELLKESSKYVKKNDYLFAYDNIPMIHFLTETKPYIRNSWPYFYIPEAFKIEMDKSLVRSKELPVVILHCDWPRNTIGNFQKTKPDILRDSIMNDFMLKGKYKKVWENKAFEIRIPD
jgi:hypothetical protein